MTTHLHWRACWSRVTFVILRYLFPGLMLRLLFRPRSESGALAITRGPLIIAGNHRSSLDPLFIQLLTPRQVTFLGKEEYFTRVGLNGFMWRSLLLATGLVIPLDPSGGPSAEIAMAAARAVLVSGGTIGIFPEGTRSPDGRLYRGHTGVARLALDTGAQVLPVALLNSEHILPRGRLIPRITRARIVIGQPVQCGPYVSAEVSAGLSALPATAADQTTCRAVTDAIMRAIQRLSGQEYVDSYAPRPTEIADGNAVDAMSS
jgi:1-acyl-sn-glycerol-3-phosphate acyltransferase